MAKLAELIDGMASSLQVAPSRVRTAAAQLRKHRMLSTGPRGPGALDMTPEDATNLLLAILYDGELSEAHETVPRLRKARLERCEGRRWGDVAPVDFLPQNSFVTSPTGEALTLGRLLETMLDRWVRYGTLYEGNDEDIDLEPVNVVLEIQSPSYRGRLTFNTPCSLFWHLDYEWKSPEQLEYEADDSGGFTKARWDARNGPHIWSCRSVGEDCLSRLADCLRGCAWTDEWDDFAPAYERSAGLEREVELA